MPKFTLVCDHSCDLDTHIVKHEFTAEHIYDVVEQFEMFLRGAGYVFNGTLDFIDDNLQDDVGHSPAYYDFDRNKPIHEWTAVRRGEE